MSDDQLVVDLRDTFRDPAKGNILRPDGTRMTFYHTRDQRRILQWRSTAIDARQISNRPDGTYDDPKGATICYIPMDDGSRSFLGFAFCSAKDPFSHRAGRRVAEKRAREARKRFLQGGTVTKASILRTKDPIPMGPATVSAIRTRSERTDESIADLQRRVRYLEWLFKQHDANCKRDDLKRIHARIDELSHLSADGFTHAAIRFEELDRKVEGKEARP